MTQVTNRQTLLEKVGRKWKSDPIFSTGLVLALMVILQTVALGFDYESFGAWFTNWGKNWINILRNNAGVGIVALGMTFVIISGGIDLAVGSTMVAIGAVIMVFINQYPDGLLTWLGPDRALLEFRAVAELDSRRAAVTALLRQWMAQLA